MMPRGSGGQGRSTLQPASARSHRAVRCTGVGGPGTGTDSLTGTRPCAGPPAPARSTGYHRRASPAKVALRSEDDSPRHVPVAVQVAPGGLIALTADNGNSGSSDGNVD